MFNNAWTLAKKKSYILPCILNKHKNEQHFSYKHSFEFIRDVNAVGKAITFYKNQMQKEHLQDVGLNKEFLILAPKVLFVKGKPDQVHPI